MKPESLVMLVYVGMHIAIICNTHDNGMDSISQPRGFFRFVRSFMKSSVPPWLWRFLEIGEAWRTRTEIARPGKHHQFAMENHQFYKGKSGINGNFQ